MKIIILFAVFLVFFAYGMGYEHGQIDRKQECEKQAAALGIASYDKTTGRLNWSEKEAKFLCERRPYL